MRRPEGKQAVNIIDICRADSFDFFRPAIDARLLTEQQMHHACSRYRLGKSRSGMPIFWMIDELGIVRDGRTGGTWVSQLLKAREPRLLSQWHARHCLFGLHLLAEAPLSLPGRNTTEAHTGAAGGASVCIVERESSAVILSELFPEQLWLATSYPINFSIASFEPLQGCEGALYPTTDSTGEQYLNWLETAREAAQAYRLDITVKDILELHATEEQKQQKIDLVDFLLTPHGNDVEYEGNGASKRPEWSVQTA